MARTSEHASLRAVGWMLALALMNACAHVRPPAPRYPTHPVSAFDLCMAFARAADHQKILLSALERCDETPLVFTETPEGLRERRRECQPGKPDYDKLYEPLKAGRVAYDGDRLQSCLTTARQFLNGKSVWDVVASPKPASAVRDCEAVVVALTQEGDSCSGDADCPDGTACEAADPTVQKLTCLRPASLGERCETRTCDSSVAVCLNGRCERGPIVGESCQSEVGCVGGASCSQTSHRCEIAKPSAPASAEACGPCDDGSSCLAGRCVSDYSIANGMACQDDRQCAGRCFSSSCNAALVSGGKVCAPRGPLHAPCGNEHDCRGGLRCSASPNATGTCEPLPGEGDKCSAEAKCAAGLVCDPVDGCTKRRGQGMACHDTGICSDPLLCLSGACRSKPEGEGELVGEGAHVTWQPFADLGDSCAERKCRSGVNCVEGICREPTPTGAPCATSAECAGTCLKPEHVCSAVRPSGGCGRGRGDFRDLLPMAAFALLPQLRFLRRRRRRTGDAR